ncbi:MAG TPA: hypothetical protein HA254_03695 [Candidatus Diapherotrites archaeon]|uniref:Uncharacterized protein n=1 Tax=Candidatus Iainarchaeum sp. TaxID=3101447 RepID=A0A7J4IW45_9ARCH|nr:hypothetical protein [Candidatus Diapherotrites archaeon]
MKKTMGKNPPCKTPRAPRERTAALGNGHKSFLAEKRRDMRDLHHALGAQGAYRVGPVVREALLNLNKLPFLSTYDSSYDVFSLHDGSDLSINLARGQKRVIFTPAFISFKLDRKNPKSIIFWKLIVRWTREKFPQSKVALMGDTFEIVSQSIKNPKTNIKEGTFWIPSKEIDERLAASREFFQGLSAFAKSCANSYRR